MLGILNVHLVQDEGPIFRTLLEVLGPIFIAGAAVFAAQTARKSAGERQERQLSHDTERQEEALRHDREMRDRESTRGVIDQAIEAAHQVLSMFVEWEERVKEIQEALAKPDHAEKAAELRRSYLDQANKAIDAVTDLSFHDIRLSSRPDAEAIADSYEDVVECYRKHRDVLVEGMVSQLTDTQVKEIEEVDSEGTRVMAALLVTWRGWLGSELGPI